MYKTITLTIFIFITLLASLNCLAGESNFSVKKDFMIGRIIDIDAPTISNTEAITVIDNDEKIWEFDFQSQIGHFTPSHLKHHMINGDFVKVVFFYESESAIVLDITDYP